MIAYIKGELIAITEENMVVECGGIGYNIRISSRMASAMPSLGSEVKIHTYTYVKEDAFLLYGFLTKDDLEIFKKCITVNGIGPKGALAILSIMDADTLRFAIISQDAKSIAKAPGIGGKTAQRLILDLKDKVKLEDTAAFRQQDNSMEQGLEQAEKKEAVEALVALGYSSTESLRAVNQIEEIADMSAEEILKAALKKMF